MDRIKQLKNEGLKEIDEAIKKQAYDNVIRDLKKSDIEPEELSEEEFAQLMAEEIKQLKTLGKGVVVGAGVMALLNLLG